MDLDLVGKAALVTGASRGIGRDIAARLRKEGCRVAMNARDEVELARAVGEVGSAVAIPGDVTIPAQAKRIVRDAVSAFGRLDILICNVGSGRSVAPGKESWDEWQRVFALNLWSTTNMVEAARDALVFSSGAIVCISSICGVEVVPDAPVTYSCAKAALNAYVKAQAKPLGRSSIRINAIAPGNILFEGSTWARKLRENRHEVEAMISREVPLNRLGSTSDVAEVAAFLASPRAAFVTGGIWTIDGGQTRS